MRPPSDPIGLAVRLPNRVEPEELQESPGHPPGNSEDPRSEEEYDYIIRGKKGPPPNRSGLVPMKVGGEGETTTNQGGGDAPLGLQKASWEEQVQMEEEQRLKDNPQRKLPPPPPWSLASASITTPPVAPSTSDGGFITVQGWKSRDKRPRDPSKDPIPRRRPSKAS